MWRRGKQRQPREGEREGGSRAPPADKMIKRQISYIIFTLMLPYRNLWEGRDLCGRVYAPQGLIWERPTGRKSLPGCSRARAGASRSEHGERQHARTPAPDRKELCIKTLYVPDRLCQQPLSCVRNASRCDVRVYARRNARSGPRGNSMGRVAAASSSSTCQRPESSIRTVLDRYSHRHRCRRGLSTTLSNVPQRPGEFVTSRICFHR